MSLMGQLWMYWLGSALLGALATLAWQQARVRAKLQAQARDAEFRLTEQMVSVSAEYDDAIARLEVARHEAQVRLERSSDDAQTLRAHLAQRDQQIKDISTMLMRVSADLAKAEAQRRNVLQERQRAVEEVTVLRKQVAEARSELARALGEHELALQAMRDEIHNERALRERLAQSAQALQSHAAASAQRDQAALRAAPSVTALPLRPDIARAS